MKVVYEDGKYIAQSTYEERMGPKSARFRWDPKAKRWWTTDWEKAASLLEFCDDKAKAEIESHLKEKDASIKKSRATEFDVDVEIPSPDGLDYMPFQRAGIAYALRALAGGENCMDANKEVGPSARAVLIADEMGL